MSLSPGPTTQPGCRSTLVVESHVEEFQSDVLHTGKSVLMVKLHAALCGAAYTLPAGDFEAFQVDQGVLDTSTTFCLKVLHLFVSFSLLAGLGLTITAGVQGRVVVLRCN